jgi:nitroreductase
MPTSSEHLAELLRARRSVRDFRPDPIPADVLDAVLADANWAPSWSNTQPYRVAIATGERKDRLARELTACYDAGVKALAGGRIGKFRAWLTREGMPDGDFKVRFSYPPDLVPRRRATGFGLYKQLGIDRNDHAARNAQMRRNFEFFGAPAALFIFVHRGLREYAVLDAGIFLQSLMLAAEARGLATCAQGALATWAGPVKAAFEVPGDYLLVCGLAMGYASAHPVNQFNPGRGPVEALLIAARGSPPGASGD